MLLLLLIGSTSAFADNVIGYDSAQARYHSYVNSGITFKSSQLPAWRVDLRQTSDGIVPLPTRLIQNNVASPSSFTLSASRRLSATSAQRIFASLRASPFNANDYLDVILLPSQAGVAASVGWRLGDPQKLNMAVEFEHRQLGNDIDASTLKMGVHYFF